MSLGYIFFRYLFLVIFKLFFRFEVIGGENIPGTGGVIVAANHVSYLDPLVIGCAIRKRQARFMARSGLFKTPLIGNFVRAFSFPVDRDKPLPSVIKHAVRLLKKGEVIVIFPEGGRSQNGDILESRRGFGLIAAMSGAKVVPAYIDGTYKAFPRGAKFIRPAKIRVVFGNPINVKDKKTDKEFQERFGVEVMDAIKSLKLKVSKECGNGSNRS